MAATDDGTVGPHIMVIPGDGGLQIAIQGMTPEACIIAAEMIRRHAGRMMDYQEAKAVANDPKRKIVRI